MTDTFQSGRCPICSIPGAVVHYAMRPDPEGGRVSTAIGVDCPNARCRNFSPDALRGVRTGRV
jgi:hypothetical protein